MHKHEAGAAAYHKVIYCTLISVISAKCSSELKNTKQINLPHP